MIDLQPTIRTFLLNDVTISSKLSDYSGSKALFTRRPVPQDASYPVGIISPIISDIETDYISCAERRALQYNVIFYSNNDTSSSYRDVESLAFRAANLLHRADRFAFVMPQNSTLIQTTASSPFPAPTDDIVKVARGITLNVEVILEN